LRSGLGLPGAVAVDSAGNVYVVDTVNDHVELASKTQRLVPCTRSSNLSSDFRLWMG
jgi:hypothetical protein